MPQSDRYKDREQVDRLHDMPGASIPRDLLKVSIEDQKENVDVIVIRPTPIADESGDQINPATEEAVQRIVDALTSEGEDSVSVDSNDPLDVSAEVVTVDQDSPFTVSQESTFTVDDSGDFSVNPIGVTDSSDNRVDPSTEQTLSSIADSVATENTLNALAQALESNGGDSIVVDHPNRVDVGSRTDRNLGYVEVREVNDLVQTEDSDSEFFNSETLAADGQLAAALSGQGSENIQGRVVSDGQYTVQLSWQDDNGNEIFSDEIASAVAGGTETELNETAISPNAVVEIIDGSGADATVDGTIHLT